MQKVECCLKHKPTGVEPTRRHTYQLHSPEVVEVLAEVSNRAESPSRRIKSISTILLGHVNDDRYDELRVSAKGGVDRLNEDLLRRSSRRNATILVVLM